MSTLEPKSGKAYLVIEASAPEEIDKKPKWIGIAQSGRIIHIPANAVIAELSPGYYKIDHLDYHTDKERGEGTSYLKIKRYHFEENKVYLFGAIEIKSISKYRIKWGFGDNLVLLKKACEKAPEVFEKFNLDTLGKLPEMKITCD